MRYNTSVTKVGSFSLFVCLCLPFFVSLFLFSHLFVCYVSFLPQGLTTTFALQVLERDGPNALKPPKGTPEYVKFARQLAGGLQCLMWVAAAICFIAFGIEIASGNLTGFDNVSYSWNPIGWIWLGLVNVFLLCYSDTRVLFGLLLVGRKRNRQWEKINESYHWWFLLTFLPPLSLQLYLAITLIAVVVVTGCFGYYQEFKSTNIIASFKNLVPQVSYNTRIGQNREK